MAVRRLSYQKYLHLIYDMEYGTNPESMVHLPDLKVPFEQLGYQVKEYFVCPKSVKEKTKDIPKHDRNHIIFLHVDMPPKVEVGTKLEAVRYIEKHFKYVVGFRSKYCENCVWKSVMNKLFEQHKVPHATSIRITSPEDFDSPKVKQKLAQIKKPYFIKVDDGFNSLGLSNNCVLHSFEDLVQKSKEMLQQYGPVIIQPFLNGREFTVAVTNGKAYLPVERIFEKDQLVSQPGGTASEKLFEDIPENKDLLCRLQQAALQAYEAVEGSAYGRVDLRLDQEGNVYVLEVNNTCSMAPQSYFEMSVEAVGSSKKKILKQILKQVDLMP